MKLLLSTLKVEGTDAASFLQGQMTADIHHLDFILPVDNAGLSAFVSIKGRVIALCWVIKKSDDCFHLLLPEALADKLKTLLSRYIFRAKVILSLHKTQEEAVKTLPSELLIPWITEATSERYVPQRLSLDVLRAVNFKKGCYTGQEIVARMQYLGTPKWRLALVKCDVPIFEINQEVYTHQHNEEAGKVVYYTNHQALMVMSLAHKDEAIHIHDHPVTLIKVWE